MDLDSTKHGNLSKIREGGDFPIVPRAVATWLAHPEGDGGWGRSISGQRLASD